MTTRRLVVTSALPYANGEIHIGHLVEYIQTDIWVRFQKMTGNECIYICADDTHGTPIMISAREQGITPEELIGKMYKRHIEDFKDFHIEFDNYYTTNSKENKELAEYIYFSAKKGGHIVEREIEQYYCEKDTMFLPDRFIRGKCPKCGAEEQYGDSCEKCSTTYSPLDLTEVRCAICGSRPVIKKSTHLFFKLSHFTDQLKEWATEEHVQIPVRKKLDEWFKQGLQDWDISRDAPYFGFEIPDMKDKYFYVWLDAPIGYIASTKNWCSKNNKDFDQYWRDPNTEIHHFIGKDIMYFHTLFWPAMLMCSGFSLPTKVHVHGFLTVNGTKMSKSRGTFITARTYLRYLDPQYLRYYYACKLNSSIDDIDLSLNDFISKVNSDLVGKYANLASRSAPMLLKNLDGRMGRLSSRTKAILSKFQDLSPKIRDLYENCEYNLVTKEILSLADSANKFFEDEQPWNTIKSDPEKARETLTFTLNAFRIITLYLKPILPKFAECAEKILNISPLRWDDVNETLEDHRINEFKHIIRRIKKEDVDAMIEASKESIEQSKHISPIKEECTIEDFMKIDLRVGTIEEAKEIKGANKLIQLKVSIGKETRNIIAGIKEAYKPEELIGKSVVIVANLKPKKMKFGISEGMILAAGEGNNISLITLDREIPSGECVH